MSKFIDNFKVQTLEKKEFILNDLAREFAKAQQFKRLCCLLTDFGYLQVKLEKLGSGNLENTLKGHLDLVNAVAVTPDGKKVISGSRDNSLKVWDLETGNCIFTFTAEARINCVAVAPDGVSIIAGDSSGKVHFLRLMGV